MICRIVFFLCLSAAAVPAAAAPISLNFAATINATKSLLARGGQARVLVIGDSLSVRDGSYLPFFRAAMQKRYGAAGAGYYGFTYWTGGGFDSGWTMGMVDADTDPHMSLDGLWASTDDATTAYMTAYDSQVTVQYLAQNGGGHVRLFAYDPAGAVHELGTINTSAAQTAVKTFKLTMPDGAQAFWFQTAGDGPVTILGTDHTTDDPGVRISRAANGGWGVANFENRDATFDAQLKIEQPNLVLIWLGQNDQGYSQADYQTHLTNLTRRIKADVSKTKIVLIGTYDQGSPNLPRLVEAMYQVALNNSFGFINMYRLGGSVATLKAAGYIDTDGVHFTSAGGQYFGNVLYNMFYTNGASSSAKPRKIAVVPR